MREGVVTMLDVSMKILYKQPKDDRSSILDITNCHFKSIRYRRKNRKVEPRTAPPIHHHTEYEIHMVTRSRQTYQVDGIDVPLSEGMFLIIPPHTKHHAVQTDCDTQKVTITFQTDYMPEYRFFVGEMGEIIEQNIRFIYAESQRPRFYSSTLLANRIFETTLLLLRIGGYREAPPLPDTEENDDRLALAKKYIMDNYMQGIKVADVAEYCRLSTRQLTRIFLEHDSILPSRFITHVRMQALKAEVQSNNISFKVISEKYGYNNEYYFNRAFKAYFGMPPGAYRQMYQREYHP